MAFYDDSSFIYNLKMSRLISGELWFKRMVISVVLSCEDDSPREVPVSIDKCENEPEEKLFDMLQTLLDKSDVDQWQINDESDEEDDLVSWSEEGSSLDEITDSNDSNLKIKMVAQMIVLRRTEKGPQRNFSFCQ